MIEQSSARKKGLVASDADQRGRLDDWVADLRRICLDNLEADETQGRRAVLRDRLFPLGLGKTIQLRDVLYSASAWSSGTLTVCFLAFLLSTGHLVGALAFTLLASLLISPLLLAWAAVGYYYVRKQESVRKQENRVPSD